VKLSQTMADVLAAMAAGWELGKNATMDGRAWLQKLGVGRGGPTRDIRITTWSALLNRGFIKHTKGRFPTKHYVITDLGASVAAELTLPDWAKPEPERSKQ
jgi:hypothetical protein